MSDPDPPAEHEELTELTDAGTGTDFSPSPLTNEPRPASFSTNQWPGRKSTSPSARSRSANARKPPNSSASTSHNDGGDRLQSVPFSELRSRTSILSTSSIRGTD